jgi:hypothetical protein
MKDSAVWSLLIHCNDALPCGSNEHIFTVAAVHAPKFLCGVALTSDSYLVGSKIYGFQSGEDSSRCLLGCDSV